MADHSLQSKAIRYAPPRAIRVLRCERFRWDGIAE